LILTLGTYGTEGLTPSEQQPLIGKLLALYEKDPDAGIHGAAEWTLWRWGQQESIKEKETALRGKEPGEHRWYVNGQGQTFALIDGPVEFQMGSPPNEPHRSLDDMTLHRQTIPRRLFIAAKEVTIEQFQQFLQADPKHEQYGIPQKLLDQYSDPKHGGPMICVSWYAAAAFCNWLSRKENLPECYEPNNEGKYAEGMMIPADSLQRTGYRLPTEAEWEYACRAGAITSRYYGLSEELLGQYVWYLANTFGDRAQPCGTKMPNDLGLFDMIGNVFEWCDVRSEARPPDKSGKVDNNIEEYIKDKNTRPLRGGTQFYIPPFLRSAIRRFVAPSYQDIWIGFRPSRTYP
jgi:formylglycine-generating enzyme required for sulfatase activity